MNPFDQIRMLQKKKQLTKMDKARFLAAVPDTTISMHVTPDPKAVIKFYTEDDINELFDYWYHTYEGMMKDRDYLWKSEK